MQTPTIRTTTPALDTEPATGVRWLNWTLRALDATSTEILTATGRFDELRDYFVRYVIHATEGNFSVRWSEAHSIGYTVTDPDGATILHATLTAIESSHRPTPMARPECCATRMQPGRDPERPDTALLVCPLCGASVPEFD